VALERCLVERAAALAELVPGVGSCSDEELREVLSRLGAVRRLVDAVGVRVAGEVERRCHEGGLAARWGERSAAALVAGEAGIDAGEARDWCAVGAASAARWSLTGEELMPARPEIAAAVERAALPARALARIVETLDEVDRRSPGHAAALAPVLLAEAPHLAPRELGRLCRFAIDRADPDGVEPREEELRRRAGIVISRLPDGMLRWIVTMDAESAGFLTTAMDARTAPRREPRFGDHIDRVEAVDEVDEAVEVDPRTLSQRRLDALVGIARDALRADAGSVAGTAVTMLVTIPWDTLRTGIGSACIDGIDAPISARTARRLAADAELIPVVLGGESEPLDLGRAARLFSPAQRRALTVRDGGCLWPGCTAPPGWCEVAHVQPWARGGPTDLDNAMLLCPFHHRHFDLDGWTLHQQDKERWLVPPSHIDTRRTPRRVGRRSDRVAA
jgi:hypothetical protein